MTEFRVSTSSSAFRLRLSALWTVLVAISAASAFAQGSGGTPSWMNSLLEKFGSGPNAAVESVLRENPAAYDRLKIIEDWIAQDGVDAGGQVSVEGIKRAISELGPGGKPLADRATELASVPASDRRWAELYLQAAEERRAERLKPHMQMLKRVVFTKHFDLGGSHYAYTEALSDANAERNFRGGTSLCLLEMDGIYGAVQKLIDDRGGVIRDPDVSYDGSRILFSWKKSLNEDDYHLYEMSAKDQKVRQLTNGLGYADYECAYLPSGDIIFNSSRCIQAVDCWWTEVSNIYTCDPDGRFMRRLSFDQVHTNFPTLTPDGRVIYTRWDYSDRGQIYPQGLFQMFPDGTGQSEVYGNNSWFPTSILHARAIPGSSKIVCIFSGHHSRQQGWLGMLDPTKGRQENSGAWLIAPVRPTDAARIDSYGQNGDLYQYPFPLSERDFLVTYKREGQDKFVIAYVNEDGRREILACAPDDSCNQPVPLAARPKPHYRPSSVDYRKTTSALYIEDIYKGPGLQGIARGTIKNLRVVALDYRAVAVGSNGNGGPAGGAMVCTPISIQGTWDVKKVLGTATVHEDGSACFIIPARTPVYFQALDAKGHAVQTMRSWVTLQPGEKGSCVGCHEHKNSAPTSSTATRAMAAGPQWLKPWQGQVRGFSFVKEVQPILDKNCVKCHTSGTKAPFTLTGDQTLDPGAGRKWSDSYKALANRSYVNWINIQSEPSMQKPYSAGAAKSKLVTMLEQGHGGVKLSQDEMDRIACWIDLLVPYCGDYTETFEGGNLEKYQRWMDKRKRSEAEEAKNIQDYIKFKYETEARK